MKPYTAEELLRAGFNAEELKIAERIMNPPPRPIPATEDLDPSTQQLLHALFEKEHLMARQLQHDTVTTGGPCKRCGLAYSLKTAYVPCFQEGPCSSSGWRAFQVSKVSLLRSPEEIFKPKDTFIYE